MTDNDDLGLPPLPAPPAELATRIREQVSHNLSPERGPSGRARWALGIAAVAVPLIAVLLMTGHYARATPDRTGVLVLVAVALVAAATFLTLARGGSARTGLGARLALAFLPAAAFLLVVWIAYRLLPGATAPAGATASTIGCLARGLMLAFIPMGVIVLLWRHTDPFTPRLTGAIIGGWSGLTGSIALTLACPSTSAAHILIGHGGAILAGALLGALLGRRLLSP